MLGYLMFLHFSELIENRTRAAQANEILMDIRKIAMRYNYILQTVRQKTAEDFQKIGYSSFSIEGGEKPSFSLLPIPFSYTVRYGENANETPHVETFHVKYVIQVGE